MSTSGNDLALVKGHPATWQAGEALRELIGMGELVEFAGVTILVVPDSGGGAIVRAMRDEDNRIVAAKWARIEADLETRTDAEITAAGQALLEELGPPFARRCDNSTCVL
jgi:hypothetical protein